MFEQQPHRVCGSTQQASDRVQQAALCTRLRQQGCGRLLPRDLRPCLWTSGGSPSGVGCLAISIARLLLKAQVLGDFCWGATFAWLGVVCLPLAQRCWRVTLLYLMKTLLLCLTENMNKFNHWKLDFSQSQSGSNNTLKKKCVYKYKRK